jgi:hypothetical protein
MPNGRTSLFYVTKADFGRLLGDLPDDAEIGKDIEKSVTTLEVKRLLDEQEDDKVTVDEQDHTWYLVTFMNPTTGQSLEHPGFFRRLLRLRMRPGESYRSNQENLVSIGESSPLHSRLRQYHTQWVEGRHRGEVIFLHGRFLQYDGNEWRAKKL